MIAIGIIHAYPNKEIIQVLSNYEVHLFAPVGYNISINSKQLIIHEVQLSETIECIEKIYEIVKKHDIKGFLPLYEGGILLSAIVSAKAGLNFYSIPTALASRNKYYLKQVMRLFGVPVPNSIPVYRFTPYEYVAKIIGNTFILKVVDSMNSQAVMLVQTREEYYKNIQMMFDYLECEYITQASDRNRFCYGKDEVKVIAQEYCNGEEVNMDMLICGNAKYPLGIFQKANAKGPFFPETMSYYPSGLSAKLEEQIIKNAKKACEALDIKKGIIHLEFRIKEGVPHLLDMGLRPGGAYTIQAVEEIYGINAIKTIADIFIKGKSDKVQKTKDVSIIYGGIVFNNSGILKRVDGIESIKDIKGIRHFIQLAKVGDYVTSPPYSAQPHFCYYYISGESIEMNKKSHYRLQETIKLDIEKNGVKLYEIT